MSTEHDSACPKARGLPFRCDCGAPRRQRAKASEASEAVIRADERERFSGWLSPEEVAGQMELVRAEGRDYGYQEGYEAGLARGAELRGAAIRADERAKMQPLIEALEFYADPATYHALSVWADPPCGDFVNDYSEDHGDDFYDRPMPGKTAREALAQQPENEEGKS